MNVADDDFPNISWDASKNALYDRHIQPPMQKTMSAGEVGCALSHVRLWRMLAEHADNVGPMLILEDDAAFYDSNSRSRPLHGKRRGFLEAFTELWKILPATWDILYFGFSPRGESDEVDTGAAIFPLRVFRPEYGFHTHAYAITRAAAVQLLDNGPVSGPVDVWLADNNWFGLNVFCAMVANEGYNHEGRSLIGQIRTQSDSDIGMSGRPVSRS
mmetsp:Transcript_110322/g.318841  ORF Transcript_110322/g.318841 Transcript_110322/m.318841 type:complete len:215 (+) Transcript_110322:2-646(+)